MNTNFKHVRVVKSGAVVLWCVSVIVIHALELCGAVAPCEPAVVGARIQHTQFTQCMECKFIQASHAS